MPLRKLTFYLLFTYAFLTFYTLLSPFLGLPYHPFFTPLLTLLAFAFAVLHGWQNLGWKQMILLLLLTFGISLLFECVGGATGWIYGPHPCTRKAASTIRG